MGLLDFLFGKTKTIEDGFFGTLRLIEFKESSKDYFEGNKYFGPAKRSIELIINGGIPGPSEKQKQFFRDVERSYGLIIEKSAPLIIDEFRNWKPEFTIMDFDQEFWPVHMSIPKIDEGDTTWEMAFETSHDQNHHITITYKNFEAKEILIDG
ncbi:hypothetical protein WJR50_33965 [Catalinimonas sp. 4WD22]|uniref:hypothetical protein n=1 Tax=Catalinimonas locisalis TaxID=3133978 RepID=UPI003100CEF7